MVVYEVSGICATSTPVQIVDLTEHRFGKPPSAPPDPGSRRQILNVKTLHWLNNSEVAYEAETYPEEQCSNPNGPAPRKADSTIRISDLKFE